jgi:beta-galactosidase
MLIKQTSIIILISFVLFSCNKDKNIQRFDKRENLFNDNWQFVKNPGPTNVRDLSSRDDSLTWKSISLPHTANIEPAVIVDKQWQGTCYYRKFFTPHVSLRGKHIALKFEGAMQVADVYLNGKKLMTHLGGYLPFYLELSKHLKYGQENVLMVKLNNEDNPLVPPGKSMDNLDFNWHSGIYRNVWLMVKDPVHISDPTGANRVAGGGMFVKYSDVSPKKATVEVRIDIDNETKDEVEATVETKLIAPDGNVINSSVSSAVSIQPDGHRLFNLTFQVDNPLLWSPDYPNLYHLEATVLQNGEAVDVASETIGIRTFKWTAGQCYLNGEPLFLRGTNRHQEYPYIGYALSDNANYRDAYKIKQAGFNFVRLSHYPQSKSFMQACDELGLMTMDAIPGWQFFGDAEFQDNAVRDVRNMVRRDRNHPSVVIWEASLNESNMSHEFMQRAHNAVHEEYPGKDVYTCGWKDDVYDVFIPARQHNKPPYYWNNYNKEKPLFIAEYGDWEYYAQNAGFNQKAFENLTPDERNSRQLRKAGQKRLAQQALNYQEAHNSNLQGPACGDANWLMFDYNRGYAPDIEASGIMDIFRLPKFAYDFYKSQANIKPEVNREFCGPFIRIANFYNDPSFTEVRVYSNCDEVELLVNGRSLGHRKPDNNRISSHLPHPPCTFRLDNFEPGTLEARGYVNGKEITSAICRTPGKAALLKVWIDESGRPLVAGRKDVVFLYAAITDTNGTILPDAPGSIYFKVEGDAVLTGANPIDAEAGIASILLTGGEKKEPLKITATSKGLPAQTITVNME